MTKAYMEEILQTKTTQLAVFSVVFVLMVMVFVIPALSQEANAVIIGQAFAPPGTFFTQVTWNMASGKFTQLPTEILNGAAVLWRTDSTGFFGGLEQGTVFAKVARLNGQDVGPVSFSFSNPISGKNTCSGAPNQGPLKVTCHIPSSGSTVTATYEVSFRDQNDNNSYCDMLTKFGGLDQSKIIREKLHC